MRGHYHCLRTGCYFVTNITTKLPWHIKKHEKAERRAANGFKYFTKREECGRLGTAGQRRGQGLVAGGGAVALVPEALEAWVTSPGTYLLPPHIRLHVLLKMSQISQARHCQTRKTQNPRAHEWECGWFGAWHPPWCKYLGPRRGVWAKTWFFSLFFSSGLSVKC